jgi:hypothetical protein
VEDIKGTYTEGLKFHYVDQMMEVADFALLREKVKDPLVFK